MSHDAVNHPSHYSKGRFQVECIHVTRYMTFLAGNAYKYVFRNREKNTLEDLKKSVVYLEWCKQDGSGVWNAHSNSIIGYTNHRENVKPYAKSREYRALDAIAYGEWDDAIQFVTTEISRREQAK